MDENLLFTMDEEQEVNDGPVTCLGITFENDDKRREYFREELRKKLPELRLIEGFPIGEDDDIIALSDPPYYTACPNPWINDLISQWEEEKEQLQTDGKRYSPFTVKEPYAADVSEGKNNPIYMAHAYHTKVPHPAIMRYILHYTQPGDTVFDGFCGTGMTGVAAHLCGSLEDVKALNEPNAKVGVRHGICSDLSPYASLIAYNYNTSANVRELTKEASRVIDVVRDKCIWMYTTQHSDTEKGIIDFVVWSESFVCPNCGEHVVFWDSAVDFSQKCIRDEFSCPHCGTMMSKKNDRVFNTEYDSKLEATTRIAKIVPVLMVYKTEHGKRIERRPNESDLELLEKIRDFKIESYYPVDLLPDGYNTQQPIRTQGIRHVHEFYTKRNLIALSTLYDEISKSRYAEKLRFIFTGMMSRATIMNRFSPRNYFYGGGGWNLTGLSGTLYIPSLPIETSVLEILKTRLSVYNSIGSLLPHSNTNVVSVGSACSLTIASDSIDYIFVDPPFGSNIMYSELNFLPEAWLKVVTNNNTEAIINSVHGKTLFDYQNLMNRSFREFHRVLKPGKWLTMEFSNTSASVWNSIQNALQGVGFVVANVAALDKQQGSFKAVNSPTAVKQDLIITCFKPSSELTSKFEVSTDTSQNTWDFVEELLEHLPVHIQRENSTTAVIERSPKILFDRLIAYYVQRGYPVPMDAAEFQRGLKDRFVERDGMFFTAEQAIQYEEKKKDTTSFVGLFVLVGSEAEGIEWLKRKLEDGPKTYAEILPDWMQDLVKPKKGDSLPELMQILDENFLKDENGYWHIPDVNDQAQLEVVRNKRLLKEFDVYVEAKKIKDARLEALRAGFKECYKNKDFATIINVGDKIPEELLTTDEVLLQYYDIASSRV